MSNHANLSPSQLPPSRWNDLLSLYREFKVCRFSLIVAVVVLVVFTLVPQAVELLRSLGEESTWSVLRSGPSATLKWFAIAGGMLTWSLASWYTCRVLLSLDFIQDRQALRPPGPWWAWLRPKLLAQLPRVLGVAPLLIMAAGFCRAASTYDSREPAFGWLLGYAAGCVLLAVGFYLFLAYRRVLIPGLPAMERGAGRRKIVDLESSTRTALWLMTILSVILLGLFTANPILFGGSIGASAVLLFGAACWVFWGSAAVYVFERFRIPLLTILACWVAAWSCTNDNHAVRHSPSVRFERPDVGAAFLAWHANVARYTGEPVHPLFIVATEGGGIRAAYWTATVLGELEDRAAAAHAPDFAEHVFAISAVSGGSLGAAVFDAALAEGPAGPITPRMQTMLGNDFLAPPLAAMLYPDLLQRFLPWPVTGLDRGQWLERAWEQAGSRHLGNDAFARNFNDLWARPHPRTGYLPALFLNGTSVESGQRIIASNLLVGHGFLDGIDASAKAVRGGAANGDMPLSTAVHNSARFTYVSPAGRFADGSHVVDGGYFENSGATTALEILRAVETAITTHGIHDVCPYILLVSNDPLSAPSGGRDLQRETPAVKLDQDGHRAGSFLEDLLAPVLALANSRDAHNSYAQLALREAQKYENVAYFGLSASRTPIPLGWKLSGSAAKEMNRQVTASGVDIDDKNNPQTVRDVLGTLGGATVLKAYEPPPTAPAR